MSDTKSKQGEGSDDVAGLFARVGGAQGYHDFAYQALPSRPAAVPPPVPPQAAPLRKLRAGDATPATPVQAPLAAAAPVAATPLAELFARLLREGAPARGDGPLKRMLAR